MIAGRYCLAVPARTLEAPVRTRSTRLSMLSLHASATIRDFCIFRRALDRGCKMPLPNSVRNWQLSYTLTNLEICFEIKGLNLRKYPTVTEIAVCFSSISISETSNFSMPPPHQGPLRIGKTRALSCRAFSGLRDRTASSLPEERLIVCRECTAFSDAPLSRTILS